MSEATTLNLQGKLELEFNMTQEQFMELCENHRNLKFERSANGHLIIMTPTGGITSDRNADLTYQLRAWNRRMKLGKTFDSSGGFKLPNGADRSPDASWVKLERWNSLTPEQQEQFVPLCPDFVVELRSKSDRVSELQEKMREYMNNGAVLGWLIDPQRKVVEIYRPQQEVEILTNPSTVSGEDILPEFVLDLAEIF